MDKQGEADDTLTVFHRLQEEAETKTIPELLAHINDLACRFQDTPLYRDILNDPEIAQLITAGIEVLSRIYGDLEGSMESAADRQKVVKALSIAAHLVGRLCNLAFGIGRGYLNA